MQNDFNQMPASNITTLSRKAWTAYVRTLFGGAVGVGLLILILVLMHKASDGPSSDAASALSWALWVGLLVVLGVTAFRFISLRVIHLYYDDTGVWLYRGLLPWNKGRIGVLWRDLDTAEYTPNFFSWLLRSYRIRVGHRFTRSSEIILTSMSRGDKAVATINAVHQDLARNNRLN